MKTLPHLCHLVLGLLAAGSTLASEAPLTMTKFNITCPAPRLLPVLDRAFHECNNEFENGSCETFVETLQQLLPEYDCQRSFDATHGKNYIVPAVWLAGDGALDDYVRLLYQLVLPDGKRYSDQYFRQARSAAMRLFGSKQFQQILTGELAEKYLGPSEATERILKKRPLP